MKFTTAWANIAKENINLKVSLIVMTVCTLFLGFATASLALKEPLLIERACYTKNLKALPNSQSPSEIEEFIKTALKQRFNSDTEVIEGYIAVDEKRKKKLEQENLAKKGVTQMIVTRMVNQESTPILVEVDRIYSVKNVRSAIPTKIILTLETKRRTETNPYGLILVKAEEFVEKENKNAN